MLICAYNSSDGPRHGRVDHGALYGRSGDVFGGQGTRGVAVGAVGDVQLLPPVSASKIVRIGRNYAAHAHERDEEVPGELLVFLKPPSAVIGIGHSIDLLPRMGLVDHEVELALIVGRKARFIKQGETL